VCGIPQVFARKFDARDAVAQGLVLHVPRRRFTPSATEASKLTGVGERPRASRSSLRPEIVTTADNGRVNGRANATGCRTIVGRLRALAGGPQACIWRRLHAYTCVREGHIHVRRHNLGPVSDEARGKGYMGYTSQRADSTPVDLSERLVVTAVTSTWEARVRSTCSSVRVRESRT
jgi:hypothetical protein